MGEYADLAFDQAFDQDYYDGGGDDWYDDDERGYTVNKRSKESIDAAILTNHERLGELWSTITVELPGWLSARNQLPSCITGVVLDIRYKSVKVLWKSRKCWLPLGWVTVLPQKETK